MNWTTGLYWTDLLMIRIIVLSVFLVSASSTTATNYNNAYMEHWNCANFKVAAAGLRKAKRLSMQIMQLIASKYNSYMVNCIWSTAIVQTSRLASK